MADDLEHDLLHHLGDTRVDLPWHNARAGLHGGETQLVEPGPWTAGEEPQVGGDLARQMIPYTAAESFNPEDLWKWMARYEEKTGGRVLALAGKHCAKDGVMIAMKGIYPRDELAHLPSEFNLRSVVTLNVPGLGAERHAALLQLAAAA